MLAGLGLIVLRRRRRLFATAVAQGKLGDGVDIFPGDGTRTAPGSVGPGRTQPHQIGSQAIDTGGKTALGNLRQCLIVQGMLASVLRAVWQRSRSDRCRLSHSTQKSCGSLSKSSRRRMIWPRSAGTV